MNKNSLAKSLTFILLHLLTLMFLASPVSGKGQDEADMLPGVNWAGDDYSPVLSPDGRYLIFQSDRPGDRGKTDLWLTENLSYRNPVSFGGWTVPVPFHLPLDGNPTGGMRVVDGGLFRMNTPGFEGMPAVLFLDGQPVEIYFTSLRGEETNRSGYDGLNIYRSRFENGRWTEASHLNIVNGDFNDRMPALSSDGRILFFSSDRPGGEGGYDIWASCRRDFDVEWQKPVHLGPVINTSYHETTPRLSPSDSIFFFSSDRPGGMGHYDIYSSRVSGMLQGHNQISGCQDLIDSLQKPGNAGTPFNSSFDDESPSFTSDGIHMFFASDRLRNTGRSGFNLYRAALPDRLRDSAEVVFAGKVMDGVSRLPLALEATLHIEFETETIVAVSSPFLTGNPPDNTFAIRLSANRRYRAIVSAPGYYPLELTLDYTGNLPPYSVDRRTIFLMPVFPEVSKETGKKRMIPGRVLDSDSELPLPGATVQWSEEGSPFSTIPINRNGEFQVYLQPNSSNVIIASASGYKTLRKEFRERSDLESIELRLEALKGVICPGSDPSCLDNIRLFFGLNRAFLSEDESNKLQAIVRVLLANPSIQLEIQGHADRTFLGPQSRAFRYNMELSQKRASYVRDQLIKQGISSERLVLKGFSYSKPWKKDERGLNRRVEFRVIYPE